MAYQEERGKREFVEVAYAVNGDEYGFKVRRYDRTKELVIDPILAATFLGGSGNEEALAIALDSTGNVYVAGTTLSSDFPCIGTSPATCAPGIAPADNTFTGDDEAFVVKLDPNLSAGIGISQCNGLAVTIVGTPSDDVLIGTDGPDTIGGLSGNDKINGGEGDDMICGGSGDDELFGDGGDDIVIGNRGNDTLDGGIGDDTLLGSGSNDDLIGSLGNDALFGNSDDDNLHDGCVANIEGPTGFNTLDGGSGIDACTRARCIVPPRIVIGFNLIFDCEILRGR